MTRLGYPFDEFNDQGIGRDTDYVKFSFYKYRPAFQTRKSAGAAAAGAAADILNFFTGGFTGTESLKEYNFTGTVLPTGKGEAPNVQKDLIKVDKDINVESICLYMPEDLSVTYGAEWGGQSFTNTAAGALRTAASSAAGTGGLTEAISGLAQGSQRGMGFVAQQLVNNINAIPGAGSVGINQVLQGVAGVIINPNTELMFDGFQLRQFDFNFKLSPRNYREAKEIQRIIKAFKTASLPQYNEDKDTAGFFSRAAASFGQPDSAKNSSDNKKDSNINYIGIPSLCYVEYMRGSDPHPFLPKYKLAALTSVDVNYTPDGAYATYFANDGDLEAGEIFPVATTLSLNFTESKLVYREEIEEGY